MLSTLTKGREVTETFSTHSEATERAAELTRGGRRPWVVRGKHWNVTYRKSTPKKKADQ